MEKYLKDDEVFCALQKLESELTETLREVSCLRADRADALMKDYLRKKTIKSALPDATNIGQGRNLKQ